MRKKRKNIVGKVEESETESEDTPRDHLLIVKDFRDTTCMRNSRGRNYFILGGRGPRDHLLTDKDFRDTGCTSNSRGPNYFVEGRRG
jgi:hypothetical protein